MALVRNWRHLVRAGSTLGAKALLENLSRTGRGCKQTVSAAVDSLVTASALWLAYSLRLGYPVLDLRPFWHVFALIVPVTVLIFAAFGIYRWVVRSSNQRLVVTLGRACLTSALALIVVVFVLPVDGNNPRSLFVIYGLLLFAGTSATRLVWQTLFESRSEGEPVAIYGAGANGRHVARLLGSNERYRPVLMIDDDPAFGGTTIEGLRVVSGSAPDLRARLMRHDIAKVVIACESLTRDRMESKLEELREMGFAVKTMPSVAELVSGEARPDEIREISIADILGRSEVTPDIALMGARVAGRAVLVTGGAGSIGAELSRQIQALSPSRLVVLDSCEPGLYAIAEELGRPRAALPGRQSGQFVSVLGSVRDRADVRRVLQEHDISTVFHAAAYKHVPIIEHQPEQGVRTNVFGTLNVVEVAIELGVRDVVLVSTDKAVRPTNAMGATKRVAELILQAKTREQSRTRLSMVRFGNVLGSSGSVVPKFKQQIRSGGPVTLTHPDITRYFMTIPEAAQLVLQASAIASGGDVFVLDMGKPVKIADLARSMVRLYGKSLREETGLEGDIELVVEGLRPGEKMFEELFLSDAQRRPTGVAKIDTADEPWLRWDALEFELEKLRELAKCRNAAALRAALLELAGGGVPRYSSAEIELGAGRSVHGAGAPKPGNRSPEAVPSGIPQSASA